VKSYKALGVDEEAGVFDIAKDLRKVKAFIKDTVDGTIGVEAASENEELNELAAIVPKEIERVDSRRA
jgi:acylphosphatase